MMAPDYAWRHGFYEVKSRFNELNEEADHLLKTGTKAYVYPGYPNATGSTKRPTAEFNGVFDIESLEMIEGDLPNRAQKLVKEWAEMYHDDLIEMWKTQKFKKLPGLE